MSDDFETMPLGTIAEITKMRKLSAELFLLVLRHKTEMPYEVFLKIEEIRRMYVWLSEEYPVKV
jgi:hypothetical protein